MAHRHWQQHENEQFNDTISWFDRYTQFEFQYSVALKPNVELQHIEHSNSFVHLIISDFEFTRFTNGSISKQRHNSQSKCSNCKIYFFSPNYIKLKVFCFGCKLIGYNQWHQYIVNVHGDGVIFHCLFQQHCLFSKLFRFFDSFCIRLRLDLNVILYLVMCNWNLFKSSTKVN